MSATLPVLAGITSTVVFAFSTVPMLVKAGRTKDMSSYSLGNIVLVNVGNVVHSVYVFHLPVGPIWALHVFYLVSSAVQLTWYLRCLPRTRGGLSNVALRRVRVGTSGYGPTNSVRTPLRRRRLDRSGDRLDDAQVAFGRFSEDVQGSLVRRPTACAPRRPRPPRHRTWAAGPAQLLEAWRGSGGRTAWPAPLPRALTVDKPAAVLSGGEKTRLALATLVVSSANGPLLDEPTNSFDPASREEVLAALRSYAGAIALVTHDEGAGGGGPLARAGPAATGRRKGPLGSRLLRRGGPGLTRQVSVWSRCRSSISLDHLTLLPSDRLTPS
jgi:hypothetical protein